MIKIYISIFFFSILLIQSNSLSFQDNLFRKFNEKTKKGNFMISPLSIYQFLSLFANGASGDTKKDFLQALFPEKTINENIDTLINEINLNSKEIITNIESEDKEDTNSYETCLKEEECKIRFNIANGMFIKEGYELTDQFKEICGDYNTSYFELIDVDQINNFASERTNGKINEIIGLLPTYVNYVLVNAIYFKGMWVDKFSEEDTENRTFVNSDNTSILVETMSQKFFSRKYYQDEKVQIISLPYKSNKLDFNMIIILPNLDKYSSPSDYLDKENIVLSEIYSKLKPTENVHLYLPKFKLTYSQKIKGLLAEMGIHFDELNNMFKNSQPNIEEILHKTYIDLNENGTEAAAVTVNIFNGTSFEPEEDYIMNVNHSFIYMIQSNDIKDSEGNYLIPFVGIVNNLMNTMDEFDDSSNTDEPNNINDINNTNITNESSNSDEENNTNESSNSDEEANTNEENNANDSSLNEESNTNGDNNKNESSNLEETSGDNDKDNDDDEEPTIIKRNYSKYLKKNLYLLIILSLISIIFLNL